MATRLGNGSSRNVVDRNGRRIGAVSSLLIDPWQRKARLLRVEHGGLLGATMAPLFIPAETVQQVTVDRIRIDRSRTEVADGPRYDPGQVDDEAFFADVYSYYGYLPYWTPGYVSPARDALGENPN